MSEALMRRRVRALALALATAWPAAGCVTGDGGGSGGEVVERSKEQQPAWCALDVGRFHEEGGALRYVDAGDGLLDLPLGIKQTQLAALTGSRVALADAVRRRVSEAASDAGVAAAGGELERHIAAAVEESHARHARVSDIYFEKRVRDRAESYRVQVLIQMPREAYAELLQATARRLSQSGDEGLRRVGGAMAGRGEFSH